MKNTIKLQAAIWFSILATGCASTNEPVEPREFQSNYSYAYNLANQTVLTRNDSKLRDFTSEEVKELREMPINKGGNTNILFGAASILTGNLTGAISIAGGAAANLSSDHHTAGKSRWLIKLSKKQFAQKEEAIAYARDEILKATTEAFNGYGYLSVNYNEKIQAEGWSIVHDGVLSSAGLIFHRNKTNYVSEDEKYYYIGYANAEQYSQFYMVGTPIFYNKYIKDEIKVDEFYKKVTSNLSADFLLYLPSFEEVFGMGTSYIDYTHRIPAIYQSGVKHEFIKPE